jgi:hypothetical protein
MKIKCPQCDREDSIKVVESCEKHTDITIENGALVFGECKHEGAYEFMVYECEGCGLEFKTSDDLLEAIDLLPESVSDVWHAIDVIGRAESRGMNINTEEAKEILLIMKENYDANVGMNYNYLDLCIDKWRMNK